MRDFLPADVRKRNYVINIIREVYESYGFEPLETPAVENLETLTGKYGEEGGQLMFKILKRGEKLDVSKGESGLSDLALRYDLTVPLARVVANYKNELPKFFKRYQIQPVWRADRPARGRFREFYQCDVDAIGSKSMLVEAELISAVGTILKRLGFSDFIIRVNHREILFGILECAGIPKEKHVDALTVLDKIDKIGFSGVQGELEERGIDKEKSQSLWDSVNLSFDNLRKLEEVSKRLQTSNKGVDELKSLFLFLNHWQRTEISFDFSLVRGLSYYTGAIFEINVPDLAGSLGGGGRYDGLIGMFGKEQIPACGFSLGLERILVVMDERGMFPDELKDGAADVMVTVLSDETAGYSLEVANELRRKLDAAEKPLRVLVYPQADKFDKQLKYSTQIGAEFVCIIRESEVENRTVSIKNLSSREQKDQVPFAAILDTIRNWS